MFPLEHAQMFPLSTCHVWRFLPYIVCLIFCGEGVILDPQPILKLDINNASQHYSLPRTQEGPCSLLPYIPLGDGHFVKYMFIHGLLGLLHGVCNNIQHCSVPKSKKKSVMASSGQIWTKHFVILLWTESNSQYWSDIFTLTHLISGNLWKSLHYNIRKLVYTRCRWVQFKWSVSIFEFDVVFDS